MISKKPQNDFLDSIDDILSRPSGEVRTVPTVDVKTVYTEPCPACRGSGLWKGIRPCFKCNSKGTVTFKTARATRVALKEKSAVKKIANQRDNLAEYTKAKPHIVAWCQANNNFGFAASLFEQIVKRGELTDNQEAAVEKIIYNNTSKAAAKVAAAPSIEVLKIQRAFEAAASTGLKRLKLRYHQLEMTIAKNGSGAIYVTSSKVYIGKIVSGKWLANRDCQPDDTTRLLEFEKDPHAAAIAEGKRTNNCCCCGKLLTDPTSVKLGIGPICESKWGW